MKQFKLVLLILVFLSIVTIGLAEDMKFPKASQSATVTQTVGLVDITIKYHRPGVKGREIWGKLVPLDKVWRTGANNATTIEFSHDVTIEGNKLAKGKYALFTIPGKDEWTFIFSKQTSLWGASGYKEDQDALRVKVKPMEGPNCEWMNFMFGALSDNSAKVMLRWEKLMVGFKVEVDTAKMVMAGIEKEMGGLWVKPYYAADHAFKKEMFDKAKEWIGMSVSIKPMYWNMLLKAKIYKKLAKTKKDKKMVVKLLQKTVMLTDQLPESQKKYATEAPKLLEEMGVKKKKK